MKLSELKEAIEKATGGIIPCHRWCIRDPEEEPLPHACIAKTGSGTGLYADDNRYCPTARAQMYLAMKDDESQEEYEELMDNALESLNINFEYSIGYNRNEALIVKIYSFEYIEKGD